MYDDVFVVYVLLEFEKPLEVASKGVYLSWRRKKKMEKMKKQEVQDHREIERRGPQSYHECIARNEASEVMS